MTPNGAVAFAAIMLIAAIAAGPQGLAVIAAALTVFAIVEVGAASIVALRRAAMVMLPLAVFMLLVWVGLVGRAPHDIAAGVEGSRGSALSSIRPQTLRTRRQFLRGKVASRSTSCRPTKN